MSDEGLRQPREWQHWWNGHHPLPVVPNPRRQTLVRILADEPGLNIHELAQRIAVTRTAAKYHLRRLEREHLVVKIRRGHHQLFFPATMSERRRDAIVMLRIGAVRLVAQELFSAPRSPLSAVARKVQLSTRQVRRIVRRLENFHLIEFADGGRESRHIVHMHPELRLLIAHATDRLRPEEGKAATNTAPAWVPGLVVGAAHLLGQLQ